MPELRTADRMTVPVEWFAGVIDARGHIEVSLRHDKPQPRLSVTTRRLGLLHHLAALTGVEISVDERGYVRRQCSDHCQEPHVHVRQSAKWRVDSARATIVLWNVRPHVVAMRSEVEMALRTGLQAWPAARGNTGMQMAALGWEIPPHNRGILPENTGGSATGQHKEHAPRPDPDGNSSKIPRKTP